ncbi:MAG: NgoFVII family restriction endonuclease [Bacteroidetes bacterium]|nr:MAG: NgoFVII family restriction endonuclease [Bacteroidota bacterium]
MLGSSFKPSSIITMALNSTVLFGTPQSEIASLLNQKISNAIKIKIITGFATVEGIKVLENSLSTNPSALDVLVVGAGTYKAYEALDRLIGFGVPNNNLYIHLGHTRMTKSGAKHPFYRYHPMLHSKIYYFENDDKTACAFVGSHNVTGFALMGLNGEASIMLEGDIDHPEFKKIRNHIEQARIEAISYNPTMKEAYTWWTFQFMEGLTQKTKDIPKDFESKQTILAFCQYQDGDPANEEVLYFELPSAIGKIHSFRADVHVFIFDTLPSHPSDCLSNLNKAKKSYWCRVEGVENDEGGRELLADWYIEGRMNPILRRVVHPFRPNPAPGMQQVRVRIKNQVYQKFEYLFGKGAESWIPTLNDQSTVYYDKSFSEEITKLELIPPEGGHWYLVSGLIPKDIAGEQSKLIEENMYQKALIEMQPESGAFILFSTRRRNK